MPVFPRKWLCVVMLTTLGICLAVSLPEAPAERPKPNTADYKAKVSGILQQSCVKCHGAEKPKGGFRIDTLDPDLIAGPDGAKWEEVLNQVNIGAMPPKGEKQLEKADRETLTGWIQKEIDTATEFRESTGGRGVIRRLTRYEYNYTLQDLLELPINHTKGMPDDRAGPNGLKNNAALLGMTPGQLEMYFDSANVALKKAMIAPEKPKVLLKRVNSQDLNANQILPRFGTFYEAAHVQSGIRLAEYSYHPYPFKEAPREGPFRVRVMVGGSPGRDKVLPSLQLWLGYRVNISIIARKLVAEIPVKASLDNPQILEFQGFLEDFPSANPVNGKPTPPLTAYLIHDFDSEEDSSAKPDKPKNKKETHPGKIKQGRPFLEVKWLEFEAPFFESWPPPSRKAVVASEDQSLTASARARLSLTAFANRAWRRPVPASEIDPLVKLFDSAYEKSRDFDTALREVETTILASPKFLYMAEPTTKPDRRNLNAHELASRLSYFLWCSLPDAELRKLADSGELLKPDVLAAQTRRLLADPKSQRFAKHFTEQWLGVDQMDAVAVNPERYPRFKEETKAAMRQEPIEFFRYVLANDRSALDFLSSDYAIVNEALAFHYGLKGVDGPEFRKVPVRPSDHRGGLLTMGCFMMAHSNGLDSHPILRGKWLLKDLLNEPPPPPPPGVPELNQADAGFAKLPLKKQLELHREHVACAGCHAKLDPWGLSLENYDAIGRWRASGPAGKATVLPESNGKRDNVKPIQIDVPAVDASVKLPDGTAINGVEELKKYTLDKKKDEFAKALVRKLLAYALGRTLEWTDRAEVDRLTKRFAESDYKLKNLITDIVLSKPFQTR